MDTSIPPILGMPFVERSTAHTVLPTQFRNRRTILIVLEDLHNLAV